MPGLGTLINVVGVLIGAALGLLLGARLPQRIRETIMAALGLLTLVLGVKLSLETSNILIVLGSLLLGGVLGEVLRLEERINGLGRWFERRTQKAAPLPAHAPDSGDPPNAPSPAAQPTPPAVGDLPRHGVSRFSHGFLVASLLFCVGPMAILGSLQDGLRHDYSLLAIKSIMDCFAALAFASTLGPGVIFAALPVLAYQGALTALAGWASTFLTDPMIAEMTATGGVLLVALALGLLEIKRIRVGNLLPALLVAPLVVAVGQLLGG